MIRKAVIPTAGQGTRLLPSTKEMPKEMLPVFSVATDRSLCVKPLLQTVFEQLYDFGTREFCFVVGRGKKSISDHFASDKDFLEALSKAGRRSLAEELRAFYKKLDAVSIAFVNQPEPIGFGDAVLRAEPYVNEPFLVQAGDTLLISDNNIHLKRLVDIHQTYGNAATFVVQSVKDPRPFGVIRPQEVTDGVYRVKEAVEKPKMPPSNLAITAVYVFTEAIFDALRSVDVDAQNELQLTSGIQRLIDQGLDVMAVSLQSGESWLDVGSPLTYWDALNRSYTSSIARAVRGSEQ